MVVPKWHLEEWLVYKKGFDTKQLLTCFREHSLLRNRWKVVRCKLPKDPTIIQTLARGELERTIGIGSAVLYTWVIWVTDGW